MQQSKTIKKYGTYKDSGIEWIGEIPQEWHCINWGLLISLLTDYTANGSFADLASNVTYLDDVNYARLIRLTDLRTNLKEKGVYVNEHAYNYLSKSALFGGELLLANVGANAGYVCEMPFVDYKTTLAPNMMLIKFDKDKCNNHFMYYVSQCEYIQQQLQLAANKTTAQPKLNKDDVRAIYCLIPSLPEQQRIAEYLDKKCEEIDRVVETEKTVIERLKEYKQSIITEAVTKGLDKSAPLKDSGIEWIGKIPQHWETCKLLKLYKERKCKNKGNIETNVLSLSYGNIKKRNVENNMGLLPESFETYNIIVPDNIVLRLTDLQNDHRSLRCGLVKEQGIITSAYVTLEKKLDNISSNYYYRLLHTFDIMKGFYGMGDGVRQNLKYDGELCNLLVVRPPYAEQQQIAEYLDKKCSEIDKAIADKEQVIEKFTEYKKSLIYECVTGKRKVAE
ncbi:restriction endonuclease subunit S [bacterium]|nr:restriction endonuclease subunit S [bacterium]